MSGTVIEQLSRVGRGAVRARDWKAVRGAGKAILDRSRGHPEGFFLQGLANAGLERRDSAMRDFERALAADDARYDAGVELAGLYLKAARHGDAARLIRRHMDAMRGSPLYLDKAATILSNVGLPDEAWPLIRRANALQPGVDSLQANLAACSVYVGEIDAAKALYRELIERNPRHQRNHYELSRLGRATDTTHIDEMRGLLESSALPPERNVYLYYAIGKELEDLERWDEAFDYYRRGGGAAKAVGSYDVAPDIAVIDAVIEHCHATWLQNGNDPAGDDVPVFVCGLPRTGTTLAERILSSHSAVGSVGESFFLQQAVRHASRVATRDSMSDAIIAAAAKTDASRILAHYLDSVAYRRGAEAMFVEKLPENVLYLGFAAKASPNVRFVLLRRHPMDSCFALYKQSFFRFAYDLDDLGAYYMAYDRLVTHWKAVLGERLIELRYEDLVASPEAETRRLLERLGLPFEPACLEFDKNTAASNTASTVQIREQIHTRSVERWKRFESQLGALRRRLGAAGIETG